jgi:hypothetical protein
MDHPFGGCPDFLRASIVPNVMLEAGLVLLSILCFAILDRYVAGCERM